MLKRFITSSAVKSTLLLVSTSAIIVALMEVVLRDRVAHHLSGPSPEILAIQPHLRTHPTVGFTWNRNVPATDNIVFEVADASFEPLSTDGNGFKNHPQAIAEQKVVASADIIGLGDSFVEHASHLFHERFAVDNLQYYSMAIHRQAPPQYNAILEKYALPLNPKWIVYGIFENDFAETEDFDNWKTSGLDWFTFHSGTWCGRPLPTTRLKRVQHRYFRGFEALYVVLHSKLRGDNLSIAGPTDHQLQRVTEELLKAQELTQRSDARLLLLLIPGRAAATTGASPDSEAYDLIIDTVSDSPVEILDLRPIFEGHSDPASLYYEIDGHWNETGIALAADAILDRVRTVKTTD